MATFTKRSSPQSASRSKRFFSKKTATNPRIGMVKPEKIGKRSRLKKPQSRLLDKIDQAIEGKTITPRETHAESEAEVAEINRMITLASEKIKKLELKDQEDFLPESSLETRDAFNGVSSNEERFDVVEEQLINEQRKAMKLKHELDLLKAEFVHEKEAFEKTIAELKRELHRTTPLQDNKFFSLSKELREAVDSIEKLSSPSTPLTPELPIAQVPPQQAFSLERIAPDKPPETPKVVLREKPLPPQIPPKPQINVDDQQTSNLKDKQEMSEDDKKGITQKPPRSKKKLLLTGGAAVALLIVLSGILSYRMVAKPKVDEKLVAAYLSKGDGSVQGITTDSKSQTQQGATSPAETYAEAQAEVSFNDSIWDTYKDPTIGIMIEYPKNAVNFIKTESSVTFIRKSGYLVKVQRVETALSTEDYWNQIKATNLNYTVEKATLGSYEALRLELQDPTDYPGNRLLVKENEVLYDIWYATPSPKFTEDDIKRVQKMIGTFTIIQ